MTKKRNWWGCNKSYRDICKRHIFVKNVDVVVSEKDTKKGLQTRHHNIQHWGSTFSMMLLWQSHKRHVHSITAHEAGAHWRLSKQQSLGMMLTILIASKISNARSIHINLRHDCRQLHCDSRIGQHCTTILHTSPLIIIIVRALGHYSLHSKTLKHFVFLLFIFFIIVPLKPNSLS